MGVYSEGLGHELHKDVRMIWAPQGAVASLFNDICCNTNCEASLWFLPCSHRRGHHLPPQENLDTEKTYSTGCSLAKAMQEKTKSEGQNTAQVTAGHWEPQGLLIVTIRSVLRSWKGFKGVNVCERSNWFKDKSSWSYLMSGFTGRKQMT